MSGYRLDPSKPAFSLLADDDITNEFLRTESAPYLASDRLPSGPSRTPSGPRDVQQEYQTTVQQMRQVEKRTLESSKRSVGLLHETERIGVDTAEELTKQGEQLKNTERRLDNISSDLKDTQRNINGIKSVFSSLKNWWSTPKPGSSTEGSLTQPTKSEVDVAVSATPALKSAYEASSAAQHSQRPTQHPAYHLRGLEEAEEEEEDLDNFRESSRRVNAQLDSDLDDMAAGLSRLRGLATGLGAEIQEQNEMIDRIHTKADTADSTIRGQNTQIKKILKR